MSFQSSYPDSEDEKLVTALLAVYERIETALSLYQEVLHPSHNQQSAKEKKDEGREKKEKEKAAKLIDLDFEIDDEDDGESLNETTFAFPQVFAPMKRQGSVTVINPFLNTEDIKKKESVKISNRKRANAKGTEKNLINPFDEEKKKQDEGDDDEEEEEEILLVDNREEKRKKRSGNRKKAKSGSPS